MTIKQSAPNAIIFLANYGQEPTEAAIPWSIFKAAGCNVTFATEHGAVAVADPLLLRPTVFAHVLGASQNATKIYSAMNASREYQEPISWSDENFNVLDYDIALLPGGHDKPIRQYLESKSLQQHLVKFLPYTKRDSCPAESQQKVLGAICHGVLTLAFAMCPVKGNSLLAEYGLQTTTLPWWMEATAWIASQAWLMGNYFRTYSGRWCYYDVQQAGGIYIRGPINPIPFVHTDPNYRYVSARFPGDAELFAQTIVAEAKKVFGQW
ncbi:class I glutamine amidotransferase-like protein [Trichophaea hybrida]|nr:class I glutamine amidotransferase-like protein [Trichophaea hybrida]